MKVILVRHGQPDFDTRKWVGVHNVRLRLQRYSEARVSAKPKNYPLFPNSAAPRYCLSSELVRAQDSLLLCQNVQAEVSALFNEAELPHPERLLFPLPWSTLLVVCRLAWLFGYRVNAPGLSCDLERARQAAALLIERASKHSIVYVFGHGIMNRLIARELEKSGWTLESKTGSGYWSRMTLSFTTG